jgi:purine-cytosine permease-like protein
VIFFGYPIHRKYTKIIIVVLIILIGLLLASCRYDFDPKTTAFKYTFQSINKEKNGNNESK